jgi:hypothetical protein
MELHFSLPGGRVRGMDWILGTREKKYTCRDHVAEHRGDFRD